MCFTESTHQGPFPAGRESMMQHGAVGAKGPSPSSVPASGPTSVVAHQPTEPDSDSHSDDEQYNDGSTQNGKRKRPTSVSYVQPWSFFGYLGFFLCHVHVVPSAPRCVGSSSHIRFATCFSRLYCALHYRVQRFAIVILFALMSLHACLSL